MSLAGRSSIHPGSRSGFAGGLITAIVVAFALFVLGGIIVATFGSGGRDLSSGAQPSARPVLVNNGHQRLGPPEEQVMEYLEDHDEITNKVVRDLTVIGSENKVKVIFERLMKAHQIERVPGKAEGRLRTGGHPPATRSDDRCSDGLAVASSKNPDGMWTAYNRRSEAVRGAR
ncbi:MAG: hypothetical protein ACRDRT_05550 [Pseudonocardiaceae bacterium]